MRTAVALLLMATCLAAAGEGPRVLVLLESPGLQTSHSEFFEGLSGRGYQLDFKQISDSSLRLKDWDDWLYDKLIILAATGDLGGALDVALITEFVDAGHDLLLAVNTGVSDELRELAQEFGVDLDAQDTSVIDHFRYEATKGAAKHAAVMAGGMFDSPAVFAEPIKAPVLFRGIGLSLPRDTELAFLGLWGAPTTYSGKLGQPLVDVSLAGPEVGLVALVQARNNARVVVSGSMDLFGNRFFNADVKDREGKGLGRSGNAVFARDVSKWAFQECGVLRAHNLRHQVVGGEVMPERYRISDDVEFAVDIHLCEDGNCHAFKADDVQVELVMLDPYIRSTLKHNEQGTFSTVVKVPDQYGVFKWVLRYHRLGYSYIDMEATVPIRPFRHSEYERFILQAYPYYASVGSVMAGFFLVGFFFLYHK